MLVRYTHELQGGATVDFPIRSQEFITAEHAYRTERLHLQWGRKRRAAKRSDRAEQAPAPAVTPAAQPGIANSLTNVSPAAPADVASREDADKRELVSSVG